MTLALSRRQNKRKVLTVSTPAVTNEAGRGVHSFCAFFRLQP